MKTLKIIPILIAILLVGCDNNDDAQTNPITPTDGFTHNNVFYETPNVYISIDDDDDDPNIGGDGFPDSYTFFFTDGRVFDNDANVNGSTGDYLFSIHTTNVAFLNVEVVDNSSLANTSPASGNTYIISSNDSVIVQNGQIDALSPAYLNNGFEFGMGNENVGIFHLPGVSGQTITINAINLDLGNSQNNTIDVDYSFMNTNGEIITGHYEGTFGVILD